MTLTLNNLKTFYNAITQKFKSYRGNWEQNDPTADDYIKNRPFYSNIKEVEALHQTTLSVNEAYDGIYQPFSIKLEDGQTYKVIFDEVEYMCTAKSTYENEPFIGNSSILGWNDNIDTGEPFFIDVWNNTDVTFAATTVGEHTVSIVAIQEIIHKLDKKFIDMPDNIATEEDVYDIMSGSLGEVAFTNSYESLNNRPTIYTDYNDLNNIPCNSIVNKRLIDYTESSTDYDGGGATNTTKFSFGRPFSDNDTLQAGKKYEVVIYEPPQYGGHPQYTKQFIAEDVSGTGLPHIILGNMFLFDSANENTGDPVFISWYNNNVVYGYVDSDADVFERFPSRIEIYEITETVNQLDEKFIPDTIARTDHEHSWNDLKDRPFWRETKRERLVEEEYLPDPVITVTTTDNGGFNIAQNEFLGYMPDTTNIVVFDGVEYECEPHYDESAGGYVIGTSDFTDYPFCITRGMIITETAGTHTVEQYFQSVELKCEYAPCLNIYDSRDDDGTTCLRIEDVEKIKDAWKKGVPVRISTGTPEGMAVTINVDYVNESFIYASVSIPYHSNGSCVEQVVYAFSASDGTLKYQANSVLGNIKVVDSYYPVIHIKNKYYYIDIDSDGKLTATKL